MKTYRFINIIVLTCLLLAVSINICGQAKWTTVSSTNFHLIGDAAPNDIQKVATKLEQFRYVFSSLYPNFKFSTTSQTTVIVFRNNRSFTPYKPIGTNGKVNKWVAGYFLDGTDSNYIVLSADSSDAELSETIFHEYVHYLISNTFPNADVPAWFNEGLAEYYDQFEISDAGKAKLGGVSSDHLLTLQRSRLIPLEILFSIDHRSLNNYGGHSVSIFYAQAWAFIHMVLQGDNEKGAKRLMSFINAIMRGEDKQRSFEQAFDATYTEMEKRLSDYVERRSFMATLVTFNNKLQFDDELSSQTLNDAEAFGYLGDLLYQMGRYKDAEVLLNKAIREDSKAQMANATLGMIKMEQQKFDDAKHYLRNALSVKTPMNIVLFRYAYILDRESAKF